MIYSLRNSRMAKVPLKASRRTDTLARTAQRADRSKQMVNSRNRRRLDPRHKESDNPTKYA